MPKAKKSKEPGSRYVLRQRYVWIELVDPDDPDNEGALQVYVRSDLEFEEAEPLVIKGKEDARPVSEMRDLVAPFVADWNYYDENGDKVPPPAEAGGEVFRRLPITVFWKIHGFLVERGIGKFDVKRVAPTGSGKSMSTEGAEIVGSASPES